MCYGHSPQPICCYGCLSWCLQIYPFGLFLGCERNSKLYILSFYWEKKIDYEEVDQERSGSSFKSLPQGRYRYLIPSSPSTWPKSGFLRRAELIKGIADRSEGLFWVNFWVDMMGSKLWLLLSLALVATLASAEEQVQEEEDSQESAGLSTIQLPGEWLHLTGGTSSKETILLLLLLSKQKYKISLSPVWVFKLSFRQGLRDNLYY